MQLGRKGDRGRAGVYRLRFEQARDCLDFRSLGRLSVLIHRVRFDDYHRERSSGSRTTIGTPDCLRANVRDPGVRFSTSGGESGYNLMKAAAV